MIRNLSRNAFCALLIFVLIASTARADDGQALALVSARVYRSPTSAPILDAVVVTSRGAITAVGERGQVPIPPDARVIDCTGKTVVAGFWNSHVHFTQSVWNNAASAPAGALETH